MNTKLQQKALTNTEYLSKILNKERKILYFLNYNL